MQPRRVPVATYPGTCPAAECHSRALFVWEKRGNFFAYPKSNYGAVYLWTSLRRLCLHESLACKLVAAQTPHFSSRTSYCKVSSCPFYEKKRGKCNPNGLFCGLQFSWVVHVAEFAWHWSPGKVRIREKMLGQQLIDGNGNSKLKSLPQFPEHGTRALLLFASVCQQAKSGKIWNT